MAFDLAIFEANGNGGDILLLGNDLAVVNDIENMPYLDMFGGNVKESTKSNTVKEQSFDYWANNLFYFSQPELQFNSETERTYDLVALDSNGRIVLEDAVKIDIANFKKMGLNSEVKVIIPELDRLTTEIKITKPEGGGMISVVNYKKQSNGDFFIMDFNNDFFV